MLRKKKALEMKMFPFLGQVGLLNLHFDMNEVKEIFLRETNGERFQSATGEDQKGMCGGAHLDKN